MIAVAGGCGSAVVAIVDVAASAGGAVRPAAVGVAPAAFAGTDGLEQRSQPPFACIVNNRQRQGSARRRQERSWYCSRRN